jgi:hypothetical protein
MASGTLPATVVIASTRTSGEFQAKSRARASINSRIGVDQDGHHGISPRVSAIILE